MNTAPQLGFLGFGEAAYHLARGLRQEGVTSIAAYDINTNTPERGELIRRRAAETATRLVASNAELAAAANLILSTVTANQALAAAEQTLPHISARHTYADLNSVSPALKRKIGEKIAAAGAKYVEVAVMAPVPPQGHKVPMLTGGVLARELADMLAPFGMQIEVGSTEIGSAAATKMCRSIMIKGMEALITECVLCATRYGADEPVLASLNKSFPGIDWPTLASYMISRVVVHGERRAREMEEVVETLRSSGVDSWMAEATTKRMDWSVALGLKARFEPDGPKTYREFARVVAELQPPPES